MKISKGFKQGPILLFKPSFLSSFRKCKKLRLRQPYYRKILFPLGDLRKTKVRKLAIENGLVTAEKAESMGICFIGKRGNRFQDFLSNFNFSLSKKPSEDYIEPKPGPIVKLNGEQIGKIHVDALMG